MSEDLQINFENLLKLGYSLAFGVAGALIYRERELKGFILTKSVTPERAAKIRWRYPPRTGFRIALDPRPASPAEQSVTQLNK